MTQSRFFSEQWLAYDLCHWCSGSKPSLLSKAHILVKLIRKDVCLFWFIHACMSRCVPYSWRCLQQAEEGVEPPHWSYRH